MSEIPPGMDPEFLAELEALTPEQIEQLLAWLREPDGSETNPERESASQRLRAKIAEYTDLFWFDGLGRLPLIGDRLADYRSDRNFRRG